MQNKQIKIKRINNKELLGVSILVYAPLSSFCVFVCMIVQVTTSPVDSQQHDERDS